MGVITGTIRTIDWSNRQIGKLAGWVAFLMVAVVTTDVVLRYLFNITYVFVQELEWHLFGVLFLIGAGYTLLDDGHVRVDVFYQRLGPKARAWVNLVGVLFFLIPGSIMVICTSWKYFHTSWSINEGSPDPGGIPARYILKSFIPLGFVLILVQGISLGLKSILVIAGRPYQAGAEQTAATPADSAKEGQAQ